MIFLCEDELKCSNVIIGYWVINDFLSYFYILSHAMLLCDMTQISAGLDK